MKFETRPDYVVWESDFSKAVVELYGRPYSLQQLEMRGNDTYLQFDVLEPDRLVPEAVADAKAAVAAWQAEWETLKATDDQFKEMHAERDHFIDLELLAIDMHERGELPAGSYLMKIWW